MGVHWSQLTAGEKRHAHVTGPWNGGCMMFTIVALMLTVATGEGPSAFAEVVELREQVVEDVPDDFREIRVFDAGIAIALSDRAVIHPEGRDTQVIAATRPQFSEVDGGLVIRSREGVRIFWNATGIVTRTLEGTAILDSIGRFRGVVRRADDHDIVTLLKPDLTVVRTMTKPRTSFFRVLNEAGTAVLVYGYEGVGPYAEYDLLEMRPAVGEKIDLLERFPGAGLAGAFPSGRVYLTVESPNGLKAVAVAADGKVAWETVIASDVTFVPCIPFTRAIDGQEYALFYYHQRVNDQWQHYSLMLDAAGKVRWKTEGIAMGSRLLSRDGNIVVGGQGDEYVGMAVPDGRVLWRAREPLRAKESGLHPGGERVGSLLERSVLVTLRVRRSDKAEEEFVRVGIRDMTSGKTLAEKTLEGSEWRLGVSRGGRISFVSGKGRIMLLTAERESQGAP